MSYLSISSCRENHDEVAYEHTGFPMVLIPLENVTIRMGANSK